MAQTTHEQDVISTRARLAELKAVYMAALRTYIESAQPASHRLSDVLACQQTGNAYFNFAEEFVGNSDLLGAHRSPLWASGFAEDCAEILRSLPGHVQFLRGGFEKAGLKPDEIHVLPGSTAYANMQRMVASYLDEQTKNDIEKLLKDSGIPTYGFASGKVLRGGHMASTKAAWIGGGAAVLVAIIGGLFAMHKETPKAVTFSGEVRNIKNEPIAGARILAAEGQQTPQSTYSDENGVFHIILNESVDSLKLTVAASGYITVTRDANPHRTGPEEFVLQTVATPSEPPPQDAPVTHQSVVPQASWPKDRSLDALKSVLDNLSKENAILLVTVASADQQYGLYVDELAKRLGVSRKEALDRSHELRELGLLNVRELTDVDLRLSNEVRTTIGTNAVQFLTAYLHVRPAPKK